MQNDFEIGNIVQRRNNARGAPPYRFRGIVCGVYVNPETQTAGSVISSFAEPGCIQVFPNAALELVANSLKEYREQTRPA